MKSLQVCHDRDRYHYYYYTSSSPPGLLLVSVAGSMPRSVDVILRHAAVEKAQAGDKCTFTGTLVVIPDISQLFKAGVVPRSFQGGAGEKESEGFTGLKALGVRDLTYRTAFLAKYAW